MREETPEEAAIKKEARKNRNFDKHRADKKDREFILKSTRGRWSTWEEAKDFQKRLDAAQGIEDNITKPYKLKKKKVTK